MDLERVEKQLEELNGEITNLYNLIEELVAQSKKQTSILADIAHNTNSIDSYAFTIAQNTDNI